MFILRKILTKKSMTTFNKKIEIANLNRQIVLQNTHLIPITQRINTQINIKGKLKNKNIIEFFNGTTNQAIQYYKKENNDYNIVALNMANSHEPGGGYLRGATAQEEELCRTSPFLYASIANKQTINQFYNNWGDNWHNRILYTRDTLFIREDSISGNYDLLKSSQQYTCSIVTAAAPDMNRIFYKNIQQHEHDIKKMIKQIYYAPFIIDDNSQMINLEQHIIKKQNILILSAWGCGAFSPTINHESYSALIAKYFYDVLKEIGGDYKKICFAIISDKKNNFNIFQNTFMTKEKNDVFESVNIINN